jgi:hypothetical protein
LVNREQRHVQGADTFGSFDNFIDERPDFRICQSFFRSMTLWNIHQLVISCAV